MLPVPVTGFMLGTHIPGWLASPAAANVNLFVSRNRLHSFKKLPRALNAWALDSGGFTELSTYGRWTVPASQYVAEVRRFADDVGNLRWAAIQDYMCEPFIVQKTGLSVAVHQARTVESYLTLRGLAPDLPWLPVLQGYDVSEYLRHVDMYAAAGVDLASLPLVGLGSVCRRQHTAQVEGVIRRLANDGLKLHGFGFKTLGLGRVSDALVSSDSLAWSRAARWERPLPSCVGVHKNCANCLSYALAWRSRLLSNAASQLRFDFSSEVFHVA